MTFDPCARDCGGTIAFDRPCLAVHTRETAEVAR
jgi:hypothetical protein